MFYETCRGQTQSIPLVELTFPVDGKEGLWEDGGTVTKRLCLISWQLRSLCPRVGGNNDDDKDVMLRDLVRNFVILCAEQLVGRLPY